MPLPRDPNHPLYNHPNPLHSNPNPEFDSAGGANGTPFNATERAMIEIQNEQIRGNDMADHANFPPNTADVVNEVRPSATTSNTQTLNRSRSFSQRVRSVVPRSMRRPVTQYGIDIVQEYERQNFERQLAQFKQTDRVLSANATSPIRDTSFLAPIQLAPSNAEEAHSSKVSTPRADRSRRASSAAGIGGMFAGVSEDGSSPAPPPPPKDDKPTASPVRGVGTGVLKKGTGAESSSAVNEVGEVSKDSGEESDLPLLPPPRSSLRQRVGRFFKRATGDKVGSK